MTVFYAKSPNDVPSRNEMRSMSGLEFMQGILVGRVAAPPIAEHLNFRLHRVEEGVVEFQGEPEFSACNPMGTLHGGWYGTVLDSCMACAVMTKVPKGSVYTTLEYKVNIVRSIPLGMTVRAVGVVSHAGRTTGVAEGRIEGEDGRLYATGSTTCLIMKLS